jgi:hypothetical protein
VTLLKLWNEPAAGAEDAGDDADAGGVETVVALDMMQS